MNWILLEEAEQVNAIKHLEGKHALIFKHSTRCSISRTALDRLERNWNDRDMENVQPFFLDLLSYRELSNQIANQFDVEHESPQVILVKDGTVVYDSSHMAITYGDIQAAVSQ